MNSARPFGLNLLARAVVLPVGLFAAAASYFHASSEILLASAGTTSIRSSLNGHSLTKLADRGFALAMADSQSSGQGEFVRISDQVLSLARSAFGRTLAFTGIAIAFGASAWLLLMATLIVWLSRGVGISWSLALLLTALLSIGVTVAAGYAAMRYFEHTRLQATRRQFARLGFGELADFMPDADSHQSSADAAQRMAEATADAPVKKGLGIDVTKP